MKAFAAAIMSDDDLVHALAAADQENSEEVRSLIEAVRARLACVGVERIANMLATAIDLPPTDEDWCCDLCMFELAQRPGRDVVRQCAAWAKASDPRLRTSAADLLARLAEGAAKEDAVLLAAMRTTVEFLLGDHDEAVAGEAVRAFGSLCHEPRTPDEDARLLHFARSDIETIRWSALGAILRAEEPADIPMLILFTTDPSSRIRDWATFALGSVAEADTPELRKALVDRLDDPDEDTRAEAMRGLAARGDKRAVPVIAEALASEEVGRLVIEAAGLMPDRSYKAALEALQSDLPDDEEVAAALEACRTGIPSPLWSGEREA